jgi:PAS domain S-box-containing protein
MQSMEDSQVIADFVRAQLTWLKQHVADKAQLQSPIFAEVLTKSCTALWQQLVPHSSITVANLREQVEVVLQEWSADFTQADTAEHPLKRSNDRLSLALNASKMGVWEWDIQTGDLYWSPECCKIVGSSHTDHHISDFKQLVHPDDLPGVLQAIDRCFVEKSIYSHEYRVILPDGTIRWLLDFGRVSCDAQGNPVRLTGTVQDITDAKQSVATLRTTEQRLHSALDSLMEGCQIIGFDWSYVYVNAVAARYGRKQREDFTNKKVFELFPGIEDTAIIQSIRKCLEQRISTKLTEEITFQDGFKSTFECVCQPVSEGALVLTQDITDRKRAEQVSRRQQEILEGIAAGVQMEVTLRQITRLVEGQVPQSLCSILLLDESRTRLLEGACDSLPEAYNRQISGLAIGPNRGSCGTAAFTGKPVIVSDLEHDALWAEFRDIALIFNLRACWSIPILKAESDQFPDAKSRVLGTFALYYHAVREPTTTQLEVLHQAAHLASIAIERANAEKKLLANQQFIERISNASPHIIYVFDLATKKSVYVNRSVAIDLGFTPEGAEQLREQGFTALMHEDDIARLPGIFQQLKSLKTDDEIIETEIRLRAANNEWHWYLTRNTVFARSETGEVLQFIGTAQNITARRTLEEQLHQSQKMEAVGRLAGGVAHDFNNLLTVINGYCELSQGHPFDAASVANAFAAIHAAGSRAAQLTKQLLSFSRKAVIEPKDVSINKIIQEALSLVQRLMREDIEIVLNLEPELAFIHADPHQIEQALLNLCLNSRDAMPEGGRLQIETRTNPVAADAHHEPTATKEIELRVTDSGCGMSEETLAKIFEPFFTTKGIGQGTGLGLTVVHNVVNRNRGRILVESQVGKGTTFRLFFPAVENVVTLPDPKPASSSPHGKESVLLVEDDAAVRAIAKYALDLYGYHVLETKSGVEALEIARKLETPIDILVTDIIMPEMNGREVAMKVRALRPNLKVLFISGYTDDEVMQEKIDSQTEAFLEKPFTPYAFAKKVRAVLDRV